MSVVLFTSRAKYSRLLIFVLAIPPLIFLLISAIMFWRNRSFFATCLLAALGFVNLFVYLILLPRRFEVRTDSLVMVLGKNFRIPIGEIAGISRSFTDFHYGSINLSTSTSHCVFIERLNARGVVLRCTTFGLNICFFFSLFSFGPFITFSNSYL